MPHASADAPGSFARWTSRHAVPLICLGLAALVVAIYAQTRQFEFINLDDDEYISANSRVQNGLTIDNLRWAFTSSHAQLWHPLTSITHLLDVEVHQLWAGGHHVTNIGIHAAACIFLFLALRSLTGAVGPSAITACLFAVHPLRVESVAWVAERKDVLSGLFFALTLLAYSHYARRPSLLRYLLVWLALTMGLMSKATLVTVPLVLLLLDYWPLRRWRQGRASLGWLILEKLPLLLMAIGASIATVWAQSEAAIQDLRQYSMAARLANAVQSYAIYLGDTLWPSQLAAFYPHPGNNWSVVRVLAALALLAAITFGCIKWRVERPYLLVGWLWYLGMLVPMIGIVQVGLQGRADRFTYLPQIGLLMALVWAVADLSAVWNWPRRNVALAALALVLVLAYRSWEQTAYWRNSITLLTHAVECTEGNYFAHGNLGSALAQAGRGDEAAKHFKAAVTINPHYPIAVVNYGDHLRRTAQYADAVIYLRRAMEMYPDNPVIANNLGVSLHLLNRWDEASDCLEEALRRDPNLQNKDSLLALNTLGLVRSAQGRLEDAAGCYKRIIAIDPDWAEAHANLALAYYKLDRDDDAMVSFRESLRLRPDHPETLRNSAWLASTSSNAVARSGDDAVQWASRAVALTNRQDPAILEVLAAAQAETGRFAAAAETAQEALELAARQQNSQLVRAINVHLARYRANMPIRETP